MLTAGVAELVAKLPGASEPSAAQPSTAKDSRTATTQKPGPLPPLERLDEIPGVNMVSAQAIIAETGLDKGQFATARPLVPWVRISPPHGRVVDA